MKKSTDLHEQQYVIKFCVKLKKTVTEMKEMLDAACEILKKGYVHPSRSGSPGSFILASCVLVLTSEPQHRAVE